MSAPRQAIVFAGGGASGAYGVGVARSLLAGRSPATGHAPMDPEIVAGTSIGAVNAAFLVSHWDRHGAEAIDRLAALWLERLADGGCGEGAMRLRLNPLPLLRPRCFFAHPTRTLAQMARDAAFLGRDGWRRIARFVSGRKPLPERLLDLFDFSTLATVEPLSSVLGEALDCEAIRRSRRALRITATGWSDGEVRIFSNRDMDDREGSRIVLASCAIPGILPPVRVGRALYIDGSMLMYAPLQPAIQAGGGVLHLIYMNTDVASEPAGPRNSMEALFRSLVIMWNAAVEREIEWARSYNRTLARCRRAASGRAPCPGETGELLAASGLMKKREAMSGPLHPVTIHRYYPQTGYEGTYSFTNLDRSRLDALIEQGFQETGRHDCRACRCVLPL